MSAPFFSPAAPEPARSNVFVDWNRLISDMQSRPEAWSVPEALFGVLYAAANCDGDIAGQEQGAIVAILNRSRALSALGPAEIKAVNVAVAERFRSAGEKALADACAALPADARLPAFAHALDIILADGELRPAEAAFLNALTANLKIDREDVERIADVIVLKNRN